MEVTGYYLHYWFKNSGLTIQDFEAQKQQAIQNELRRFKTKSIIAKRNKQADEITHLAGEKNLESALAQALNVTAGASSGIGNLSFKEAGNLSKNMDDQIAATIMQDAQRSSTAIQNALNQLMQGINQIYPRAVAYAMQVCAANNLDLSSYEVLEQLLTKRGQIVTIDSNAGLSGVEQQIVQQYLKIQAAAAQIPTLGGKDISGLTYKTGNMFLSRNIESTGQLLSVLLGKVGGNISYLHNQLQKAVSARASKVADKKVSKAIENVNKSNKGGLIAKGSLISVKKTVKNETDGDKVETKNYSAGSSNYSFQLTDTNAALTIQGDVLPRQVAPPNINTTSKIANFKINDYLGRILQKANIDKYYYESLASGIQDGAEGSLQAGWRSMVDYAVTLSTLDYLKVNAAIMNSQYVIMNNKLVGIGNLLVEAANNNEIITYSGGKQRSQFWKINEANWKGKVGVLNAFLAKRRSEILESQLSNSLNATLVQAKINLTMLGF